MGLKAIESEVTQLEKNKTLDYIILQDIPRGTNILRSKFVFEYQKRDYQGEFLKSKARLVACGFTQGRRK